MVSGKTPYEAHQDFSGQGDLFNKMFGDSYWRTDSYPQPIFELNTPVIIAIEKTTFRRAGTFTHNPTVYYINYIYRSNPATYQLRDTDGRILTGRFYSYELSKIKQGPLFSHDYINPGHFGN